MNRRQFLANAGMAGIAIHLLKISGNALAYSDEKTIAETASPLNLWYDKPAAKWNETLPIGNGRIGAMVFGAIDAERVQLNEATLWTGRPHDYTNPGAKKSLHEMRRLIFDEDVEAAEKLSDTLLGTPSQLQAYQPMRFAPRLLHRYTHAYVSTFS